MSPIKKLIKSRNENLFNTWNINFIPLDYNNVRLGGKLFVTNENLYFDVRFDTSLSGMLDEIANSIITQFDSSLSISQEILNQWKDNGYLIIPKSEIEEVTEKKTFFKKTVTIKLSDDSEYLFDYGMLPVTKIANAIRK